MKRKVIKQGNGTLTITLPKGWCDNLNLIGGAEIDVEEREDSLIIRSEKLVKPEFTCVDITNMDRCSILYTIRNLYRIGYDEIELRFRNQKTPYYRIGKELGTLSVIKYEVGNLVGFEVIKQGEEATRIKDISALKGEDFNSILRRIFILLNESGKDLIEGISKKNDILIDSIMEKHDIITKFVSYCLRLLNKYGSEQHKKREAIYHIIASLDKIADVFKNVSRDITQFKPKISKKTISYLKEVVESISIYSKIFYKFDQSNMVELNKKKDNFIKNLKNDLIKVTKEEIIIIKDIQHILEIIADILVARMGLEI